MELLINRDSVVRLRVNQFASIDGAADERARGRKRSASGEKGRDGDEMHSYYALCFALDLARGITQQKERDSKHRESPPASLGPESPLLSGEEHAVDATVRRVR